MLHPCLAMSTLTSSAGMEKRPLRGDASPPFKCWSCVVLPFDAAAAALLHRNR